MDPLQLLADRLDPPDDPHQRTWYCNRPNCDGNPHPGAHWCDHPLDTHPTGSDYWRCRHARTDQHPPPGDWFIWLIQAGRGWGKSRCGAEWLAHQIRTNPGREWAVVAPTLPDARAVCIEGTSGLLAALDLRIASPEYNRTTLEIRLPDGTRVRTIGAENPDRARGPNLSGAWLDEVSSWRYPATWTEGLAPALRIGHPRVVITTTPKPVTLIRDFVRRTDGSVAVTRGSTFDNTANLAANALAEIRARYEGTRLGRQEIYGELLEDVDGALWSLDQIDAGRRTTHPDLARVVVAVDPSGGAGDNHDEVGIIVAGADTERHGWVLADRSGRYSPQAWARAAIAAYDEYGADRIVAEINYGGAMVEATLRAAGFRGRIEVVTASRGKRQRAEPVAALYGDPEHPDTWPAGRIHHVGSFQQLEDQMATWIPESGRSPDRMDALVWAVTALKLIVSGRGAAFMDHWQRQADKNTEHPDQPGTGRVDQPAA